jgi:hypothetical protein
VGSVELIRKWPWPGKESCDRIRMAGRKHCRFFIASTKDNDHCSPDFFIRCSNPDVETVLKEATGIPNNAADVIINEHYELSYLLLAMCKLCRFREEPEGKK